MNEKLNNLVGNDIVIGITMGDAGGIGPEIVVKALADPAIRRLAKFIIFGLSEQLEYASDQIEVYHENMLFASIVILPKKDCVTTISGGVRCFLTNWGFRGKMVLPEALRDIRSRWVSILKSTMEAEDEVPGSQR